MPDTTLLVISSMGVPPYAARGLQQTLEPIQAAGSMRRTINGTLVDLANENFRKYRSTISCDDMNAPAFEGFWPGMQVTVDCVAELGYETMSGAPARPVVTDSSRVEGDFTYYRPQLTMLIVAFTQRTDEYGAAVGWQLDLEEV